MYKVKSVKFKNRVESCIISIIIAVFFITILGYYEYDRISKRFGMDTKVEAYKVEIERAERRPSELGSLIGRRIEYKVTYYFMKDGFEFTYITSLKTPNNDPTLFYNSQNITEVVSASESSLDIIALFLLIVVLLSYFFISLLIKDAMLLRKDMKQLANNGTLIKNLYYKRIMLEDYDGSKLEINYKLPNGEVKRLVSDAIFKEKVTNKNAFVDLLIDLEEPDNYYIDFDICEK